MLQNLCNKGYGMYYIICWMVLIKDTLLLNRKSSSCSGRSGFLLVRWMVHYLKGNVLFNNALNTFYLRLYGIGPLPHVWSHITINKMCWLLNWTFPSFLAHQARTNSRNTKINYMKINLILHHHITAGKEGIKCFILQHTTHFIFYFLVIWCQT